MEGSPLEERVGRHLTRVRQKLATAESCTGGLIAHRVTNVAGSSGYFLGSVVAYSNEAKQALLGVSEAVLAEHGAVSEQVAQQLAEGAQKEFGAEWGIGVTGIAGPGGGTAEKPVGLVYVAVAGPQGTRVSRNLFTGSREAIKSATAEKALQQLWEGFKSKE
jgi:PncC family amidohydrolase